MGPLFATEFMGKADAAHALGEMARTVEDALARRMRALLLGARASIECAPRVACLIAEELGRDEGWEQQAVADYCKVAQNYLVSNEANAPRLSPV